MVGCNFYVTHLDLFLVHKNIDDVCTKLTVRKTVKSDTGINQPISTSILIVIGWYHRHRLVLTPE